MTRTRRIGILTGGGDVPGLNSVIKSVVYRSTELGYDVLGHPARLGGPDPHAGCSPTGSTRPTSGPSIGPTPGRSTGPAGPWLHTSRTNPRKSPTATCRPGCARRRGAVRDGRGHVHDLTPLVLDHVDGARDRPPGGDRRRRHAELRPGPRRRRRSRSTGIPKTMDNDVQGTEYCIGFSTAITRAKELINRQRTTLGSHERIGVFRIFGRDCGFTALFTAYVASGRCVIPEAPFDLDALAELLAGRLAQQPQPVCLRDHRRGRDLAGRRAGRVGRGGLLRPPPQGEHRRGPGRRAAQADRDRGGRQRADLRPAQRRGRPARPDGGDDLCQRGHGPDPRRGERPDGRDPRRPLRPDPPARAGRPPRSVDVAEMYDVERFRPIYSGKLGEPLLLSTSLVASSPATAGLAARPSCQPGRPERPDPAGHGRHVVVGVARLRPVRVRSARTAPLTGSSTPDFGRPGPGRCRGP